MAAEGGTLFLDEINSASPAMQVKLLRVLQERVFEAVGSSETRQADVRVILASNVDLAQLVAQQQFRQDLYYRINVVNIRLPNLRERLSDIPLLANYFLKKFVQETGREIVGFTDAAMAALQRHNWPGNVRELENAIERAVVLCRRPQIEVEDLPESVQFNPQRPAGLEPNAGFGTAAGATGTGGGEFADPMPLEQALQGPERRILEC